MNTLQCKDNLLIGLLPSDRERVAPAERREEEHADDEGVKHVLRPARTVRLRQILQQRRDQKHRQVVAHAIEAERISTRKETGNPGEL